MYCLTAYVTRNIYIYFFQLWKTVTLTFTREEKGNRAGKKFNDTCGGFKSTGNVDVVFSAVSTRVASWSRENAVYVTDVQTLPVL